MTIALRQRPLARVVAGIVRANDGALFDPSDLSTLFQNAAGTTPVTSVEQPVGLMLDKSQGLMLGPEEVPVDYLSNTSLWTVTNGTSQATEGKITFTASGEGTLLVVILGSSSGFKQGKYRLTGLSPAITVDRYFMGNVIGNNATVGDQTCAGYQRNAELFAFIVYSPPVGATFSIEQLSVKELYGYHATQRITASRPTLSARYNLLTKTEDFSDAVWLKTAGTIVNSAVSNPINAAQVSKFIPNTTNAIHRIAQPWNPSLGVNYTQTILLKSAGVRYVSLNVVANIQNRTTIDLQTGATISSGTAVINVMVNSLSDGWFLLSITGVGTATTGNNTWVQANNDFIPYDTTYAGDGVSGFYLIAADLRIGTTAGPYQRVNTSTVYDTDERYFPKYLRFDGIDDYLNLPYMGLYAGGSASVIAGLNGHNYGGAIHGRVISETSASLGVPAYAPIIHVYSADNTMAYIKNDVGTTITNPSLSIPQNKLLITSVIDSGSALKSYQNTVKKNEVMYTRAGVLTLDSTMIGKSIGQGNTEVWKGELYGLIITKSALSDAQRIKCERYAASKAGVIL